MVWLTGTVSPLPASRPEAEVDTLAVSVTVTVSLAEGTLSAAGVHLGLVRPRLEVDVLIM